jgi:adenylate cyclase
VGATVIDVYPVNLHFRHFQTRLLLLLLIPLVVVLGIVYIAVDRANSANALALIRQDLQLGAQNFQATIEERNLNLAIAGDGVSRDFAVRQAFNSDRSTLLSALENMQERFFLADFIAMTTPETGELLVDTSRPEIQGVKTEWQSLIELAQALDRQGEFPEASDVLLVEGTPFHVTVLPFLTPDLVGWIALGFEVGDTFTANFKESVAADLTVLFRENGSQWQAGGTTLTGDMPQLLAASTSPSGEIGIVRMGEAEYVTLAQPLSDRSEVQVVLQRSLTAQLAPFRELQRRMFLIFAGGLIVLLALITLVSRNLTQPLQLLTTAASRIAGGDYLSKVNVPHKDEIGELAAAFNAMADGLLEKERVRALLGKVVSPAIANELMSKPPELGGEERRVTVLFTDLRGFTSLCEGRSPQHILSLLNEYFSIITTIIESHGGVVDKYIGDAVMALFGAPVSIERAEFHAVSTAIALQFALLEFNERLQERGLESIATGVGINTDKVVVGNMGSLTRLNYTAIGDGVNTASRLESLSKRYGVSAVIGESTCRMAGEFLYLPIDLVRVKGKQKPVHLYTPLCLSQDATPEMRLAVKTFEKFLKEWQQGEWRNAVATLTDYETMVASEALLSIHLVQLYQQRLNQFEGIPPKDWDGVTNIEEK